MAHQSISNQDLDFISHVRPASLAEVKISQLARSHSGSDDVKRFARMMVDDHTETNKHIMRLIDKMNMTPSGDIDSEHLQTEQRLSRLQGDDFDREYVSAQMKDHEEMVSLFEREVSDGEDPEIKEFARSHLPIMQQHLSSVKNLASSLQM